MKVTLHGALAPGAAGDVNDPSMDGLFAMNLVDRKTDAAPSNGHFNVNFRKAIYKGKNILNYMFDYRAFGPSSEAADVILQEHGHSKSTEAEAYFKQHDLDTKHLEAVNSVMQLAMGLASKNGTRGQRLIDSSLDSLRQLVGEKEADGIYSTLKTQSKTLTFPKSLANEELWDMKERDEKIKQIIDSASSTDPALQAVKKDLHRYNRHSKLAIHATGLIQGALSVASFSPTLAAPAAETAYFVLIMATGGPEQDKLLRELYLSKRYESRMKIINEKAHMAVDTYHMALLSENPLLLACTQAMVRQMAGEETTREVFGGAAVAQGTVNLAVPAAAAGHFSVPAFKTDTPILREADHNRRKAERVNKPAV